MATKVHEEILSQAYNPDNLELIFHSHNGANGPGGNQWTMHFGQRLANDPDLNGFFNHISKEASQAKDLLEAKTITMEDPGNGHLELLDKLVQEVHRLWPYNLLSGADKLEKYQELNKSWVMRTDKIFPERIGWDKVGIDGETIADHVGDGLSLAVGGGGIGLMAGGANIGEDDTAEATFWPGLVLVVIGGIVGVGNTIFVQVKKSRQEKLTRLAHEVKHVAKTLDALLYIKAFLMTLRAYMIFGKEEDVTALIQADHEFKPMEVFHMHVRQLITILAEMQNRKTGDGKIGGHLLPKECNQWLHRLEEIIHYTRADEHWENHPLRPEEGEDEAPPKHILVYRRVLHEFFTLSFNGEVKLWMENLQHPPLNMQQLQNSGMANTQEEVEEAV